MKHIDLQTLIRIKGIVPLKGDVISQIGRGWIEYQSGKLLVNIPTNGFNKIDQVKSTSIPIIKKGILRIKIEHRSGKIIYLRKKFINYERNIKLRKIDPSTIYRFPPKP